MINFRNATATSRGLCVRCTSFRATNFSSKWKHYVLKQANNTSKQSKFKILFYIDVYIFKTY